MNIFTVCVDLIDHVLQLSLCGILTQGPHDCSQLFGGDCTVAILVEQGKCLLEFSNLLFCQLIGLKKRKQSQTVFSWQTFIVIYFMTKLLSRGKKKKATKQTKSQKRNHHNKLWSLVSKFTKCIKIGFDENYGGSFTAKDFSIIVKRVEFFI